MRTTSAAAMLATTSAMLGGCVFLTSLDGLRGGPATDAAPEAKPQDGSPSDAAAEAAADADADAADASADATPSLLSCDAGGLIAYWPMDEAAGTVVHDCSQGIDGIFGGDAGVSWGARKSGSNLEFQGSGYVTLGIQSKLLVPGPFTVVGWFRTDAVPVGNYSSMFWNYDNASRSGFETALSPSSALSSAVGLGVDVIEAKFPTPPVALWQHLATVFEPGVRLEVYVNGVSVAKTVTGSDGGAMADASVVPFNHEVRFGASYSNTTWKGGIDDLRIFGRALSQSEIGTLASQ